MNPRKPSNAQLAFELGRDQNRTTRYAWKWGAIGLISICFCGAFAYSAPYIGGKSTQIGFLLEVVAEKSKFEIVSAVFGFVGVLYGYLQKLLRKRTIERLTGRIAELEKSIDPVRSSSMISKDGSTRPEDAL